LPGISITALSRSKQGYLWLASFGGLVRYDGSAFTVFTAENTPGLPSSNVQSAIEDNARTVWVGTDNGLVVVANGTARAFPRPTQQLSGPASIMRQGYGFPTRTQIIRVENGRQVDTLDTQSGLVGQKVHAIVADNGGGLWVGSVGGLNYLLDPRKIQADPMPPTLIEAVAQAHRGIRRPRDANASNCPEACQVEPQKQPAIMKDTCHQCSSS
jgi:ligand-binding sensor domain-containing protein